MGYGDYWEYIGTTIGMIHSPPLRNLLKASWDLVIGVRSKVTTVIITYNPIKELITVLTKSHDPRSRSPSRRNRASNRCLPRPTFTLPGGCLALRQGQV